MKAQEDRKPWEYGKLAVRRNESYFFCGEKLFFWLADTAWLLFHELRKEEISLYLENRREKGFNVIQVVAAHHFPAVNAYGKNAFDENDVTKPVLTGEQNYWDLIDWTIREAERLGLYLAILPHWGNLGDRMTQEAMESYVRFLADRYGTAPNVIWVTGGDVRGDEKPDYWRAMGRILRESCHGQLITFHPFGRTSSVDYFPDEDWIDFHMFQSGHRRYDQQTMGEWDDTGRLADRYYGEDNWRYVKDAAALKYPVPILDAEPSYEHIPQGLHDGREPYWCRAQVRRYGWWSVLAGAGGFTYGHNSIMQFYQGIGEGAFSVKLPWKDALHAPACDDMVHMKTLMERVLGEEGNRHEVGCAKEFLEGDCIWQESQREERIFLFRAGRYLLCYTYTGKTILLSTGRIKEYARRIGRNPEGHLAEIWWMNPETGVESYAGYAVTDAGDQTKMLAFTPPAGDGLPKDYILIIRLL